MTRDKKPVGKKPDLKFSILRSLEEEDRMHDDHGPAIIGRRDRKPLLEEEKDKNKK